MAGLQLLTGRLRVKLLEGPDVGRRRDFAPGMQAAADPRVPAWLHFRVVPRTTCVWRTLVTPRLGTLPPPPFKGKIGLNDY